MKYRSGEVPQLGDMVRAVVSYSPRWCYRVGKVIGRRVNRVQNLELAVIRDDADLPAVNLFGRRYQIEVGTLAGRDDVDNRTVCSWLEFAQVESSACELIERADGTRPEDEGKAARGCPVTAMLPPEES